MTNTAPIGVFDSGVGGLSILSEIRRLLPVEDLLYLADSAHCPYGDKSVEEIQERTLTVAAYLITLGAKLIVVACNTACVAGLDRIREAHPEIAVIGVEPAVKPAHDLTRNGKIGLLATNLTVSGSRFLNLVNRYGKDVEIINQPAPGIADLVEAGQTDTPETEALLRKYLRPMQDAGVDTLVLGCTHYPFVRPLLQKICGPDVLILEPGEAVARQTLHIVKEKGLAHPGTEPGKEIFYTSGDPKIVGNVIAKLWKTDGPVRVLQAGV